MNMTLQCDARDADIMRVLTRCQPVLARRPRHAVLAYIGLKIKPRAEGPKMADASDIRIALEAAEELERQGFPTRALAVRACIGSLERFQRTLEEVAAYFGDSEPALMMARFARETLRRPT